ncbi:MAG: PLP-dependent aminotransferase family protein [Rhodospirillales bacterium]
MQQSANALGELMGQKEQWIAAIGRRSGPRYIAIVEALSEMIESGVIEGGYQLPTQRYLAKMLGLAPGTTARAYMIAAQRGLISGETGRGTFVRREASVMLLPRDARYVEDNLEPTGPAIGLGEGPPLGDLAMPNVDAGNLNDEIRRALLGAASDLDFALGRYHPHGAQVPLRFREAGSRWLAQLGFAAPPDDVVLTNGAHGALYLILFSENLRRLPVMTSALTYSGLRNMAIAHRRPLVPLEVDEHGPVPDSVEQAYKHAGGRILFLQTQVHNPTCVSMPLQRRKELVELSRKYDLIVIEDNAAALVLLDTVPPVAALAPERTFLISSCAKSISPALSVGIVSVPQGWASQLNVAIRTHHIYASMVNVEVLNAMMADRSVERIWAQSRAKVTARIDMARRALGPFRIEARPDSWFAWLDLPDGWNSESFTTMARMQGIAVGGSANFTVDGMAPDRNGVRLSLTGPGSDAAARDYLRKLRELLDRGAQEGERIYA